MCSAQAQWGSSIAFQTIKELWKPNLEIYGLEHYETHTILGRMAGLRVTKQRRIKYDTKWVQIKAQLTIFLIRYLKAKFFILLIYNDFFVSPFVLYEKRMIIKYRMTWIHVKN